jgi:hypothetical protein
MSMAQQPTTTLFLGNLDQNVTREMLMEIGIQAGPLASITIPIDQVSGKSKCFGFIVRTLVSLFACLNRIKCQFPTTVAAVAK